MLDKTGWVYLVQLQSTNLYKIGHTTRKLDKRVKEVQSETGCPNKLEVVRAVNLNGCEWEEKSLHDEYDDYRTKGEWFEFPDQVASQVSSEMVEALRASRCLGATQKLQNLSGAFNKTERVLGHCLALAFNRAVHSNEGKAKALLWHLLEWFDSDHEDLFDSPGGAEVEEEILATLQADE